MLGKQLLRRGDPFAQYGRLGVGEALVSTLDEKGAPTMVAKTRIRPPNSRIGPLNPDERRAVTVGSNGSSDRVSISAALKTAVPWATEGKNCRRCAGVPNSAIGSAPSRVRQHMASTIAAAPTAIVRRHRLMYATRSGANGNTATNMTSTFHRR